MGGIFVFLVIVFHVTVAIYTMVSVVSTLVVYIVQRSRSQAEAIPLQATGKCKHSTVPRARCTRKISPRVAQECCVT